jgi:Flp pilus assembly pilin Flp
MLVVFIALAVATGAQAFSGGLNTWFQAVSVSIAGLNSTIPGP